MESFQSFGPAFSVQMILSRLYKCLAKVFPAILSVSAVIPSAPGDLFFLSDLKPLFTLCWEGDHYFVNMICRIK